MGSGGTGVWLWQLVSYQALRGKCIALNSGKRPCFSTRTCWQLCLCGDARNLVTAKWSVRTDREEQFMSDFQAYKRLESAGWDFGYVLITNEFDAARLRAACERRRQNAPLFSQVVHISPAAVEVVYREGGAEGASAVRQHIASGRLMSFEEWLESIGAGPNPTMRRSRKK